MSDLATAIGLDAPETADQARWRALAEKALKGAPFERLTGKTADGVAIAPLLREADQTTAGDPLGLPGAAPFVRGAAAERDASAPWFIRQAFAHPDPARANADMLADLNGGVSSIELQIDPEGVRGVAIRSARDFETALAGVHADLAPVALDAGAHGWWAAELLRPRLKGVAISGTAFNLDPLGALMRHGAIGADDVASTARFAKDAAETMPAATTLRVDARPVHEAGGSEAQELGAALASGIFYLRALMNAGLDAGAAARSLLFTFAVGADVLLETAKLRALRQCWARVMEAAGAAEQDRAAKIHAVTSQRMMTRHDPWSNMLRGTAASFASALARAEAITVLPLTNALGPATPFARRIARNTHIVLMEESHVGHVIDPAGGAWFVEKMTAELAAAGWAVMQKIEAAGGMLEALKSGVVQRDVAVQRAARQKAFASRRENVTGVTDFPLLGERLPDVETVDLPALLTRLGPSLAPARRADVKGDPLAPIRWASPFEDLRDRAERAQLTMFSANLGPLAEFSARANYARNLFAAGGVETLGSEGVHDTHASLCAGWAASGAAGAVLCGTDPRYANEAADAARALKAAGCTHVVLAGKPVDEAGLRAAGVDQFIFAGQDAVAALSELQSKIA